MTPAPLPAHALIPGTLRQARWPADETDSDRIEVSSGNSGKPSLAVSGEGQASANVFHGQVGEIAKNFLLRHSGREIFKHFIDGNAQPPNAGFSAAFTGFHGDAPTVVHRIRVRFSKRHGQPLDSAGLTCGPAPNAVHLREKRTSGVNISCGWRVLGVPGKRHFSRALLPRCGMRAGPADGKEGVIYLLTQPLDAPPRTGLNS